ncbi:hypothetical protein [Micromonospora sp. MP36]|nr:hypothetical protein [Micromonospora sp. MP36]
MTEKRVLLLSAKKGSSAVPQKICASLSVELDIVISALAPSLTSMDSGLP